MDQIKIGSFIAELRKEKNLSQLELAERLGISNKAVSKWETGKGMPDVSIMVALCSELDITVNELLSGERLEKENTYNEKAEENIMNLMQEAKKEKNKHNSAVIAVVLGILAVLLAFFLCVLTIWGVSSTVFGIAYVLDTPSLILILLPSVLMLAASGQLRDFLSAFPICCGKGRNSAELDASAVENALNAVRNTRSIVLFIGIFLLVLQLIFLLYLLDEPSKLGPTISVMLIVLLYAVTLNLLLLPIEARLHSLITSS